MTGKFKSVAAGLGLTLLAGVSAVAVTGGAALAQETVKLGILTPKQGPSASIGLNMAQGAELAVAMHGGKVLGKDIETVWLDEASPQVAQQNMQKMADEYKVVGVVGGNSSAATLAMMSVAEREKLPFISAGSAASEVTGANCNRYTFRAQAPVPVQVSAVFNELKDKKIYFFTPAYAFGQDVLRTGRSKLEGINGTEVGNDEVPVNTADYSSYILKIRKAQPDAIFGALVGLDLSNFMKQWNEMGMKGSIPIYEVAVSDTDFWDIGPAAATGTHVKPWYYNDQANPDREKEFVQKYEEKYGQPPSDKAFFGWFSMNAMIDSIEAAGSTEPQKIVPAIESWTYKDGTFPYYFRDFDHQLIRPAVIVKLKDQITDKWDFMDVVSWTSKDADETVAAFGTKEEIGCTMGDL
ncbi:ABC transporter substrate-binding protein [Nitratireductor indicus]|uniref:ABC transporter substrate-binding protein n=1 Tax=Nitratireductor indicus TaxID=721133 RepID=UPI0028747DA1|nr:ABC transporter substrate-binding protein [Nitratireductor indicus]MDS1136192.1 ABC transporter substrate-binding protein [Nitratireductor indicus]